MTKISPLNKVHPFFTKGSLCTVQKILLAYMVAVLIAYCFASLFQSLHTLFVLENAGAKIPWQGWLQVLWQDFNHLAFGGKYVSYGVLMMVGLAFAFMGAALVRWLTHLPVWLLYPLAGATAMATQLYFTNANFWDLTLFPGTRGSIGFSLQLLSGAIGGFVFCRLLKPKI